MRVLLRQLININSSIDKIKRENPGIRFVLSREGDLDMEVDEKTKLSEEALSRLAQRVGIADRTYNTQFDKYNQLVKKDVKDNNGLLSNTFKNSLDSIIAKHNKQFDIEK